MHKLLGHDDRFLIQQLRSELDAAGIPYMLKNEYVGGAMGELPWQDVQQEIWLLDEAWAKKAQSLLANLLQERIGKKTVEWTCPLCGEVNEGEFAICWNCQTSAANAPAS